MAAPRSLKPGQVQLDSDGMADLLKSGEVADVVHAYAESVAVTVRAALAAKDPPVSVVTDRYVTDRAAASVLIADVRGRIYQARDGVLTKAAAAAGLEVVQQ